MKKNFRSDDEKQKNLEFTGYEKGKQYKERKSVCDFTGPHCSVECFITLPLLLPLAASQASYSDHELYCGNRRISGTWP